MWGGDGMKTNWDGYRDYYHPGPQTEPDVYRSEFFRENLVSIMERMNLTQAETAKRCGVTPPQLWNWVQGKSEPSLYSFTQVCAGLGIEPNWLLSEHKKLK